MKKMQKIIVTGTLLGALSFGALAHSALSTVKEVSAYSTYEEAVTKEKGTLVVKKVDQNGRPVAGAKITVSHVTGQIAARIVTNQNGIATVTLGGAYYHVTDTSAVTAGYYPGNTIYEVLVQPYKTKTVSFTNSYKG